MLKLCVLAKWKGTQLGISKYDNETKIYISMCIHGEISI